MHDHLTDFEVCGSPKSQKLEYLENEIMIFLQIKRFIHYTLWAMIWKKWLCSRGNLYILVNCTALKNTYFANIISFEIQARLLALLAANMFCSFTIPSTDFLEWIWLLSIFQIWLSNIYKSENLPNLANEISKSFFVVIRPRLMNFILPVLKITLIQIWKFASIFVFTWRKYAENFILKHLLLFEICARQIYERFVYKDSETKEYGKN